MRCYIRQKNIAVVWDEAADEDFMGVGGGKTVFKKSTCNR